MDLDQLPDATTIFNYQNFDEVFYFDPECSYEEDVVKYIGQNKKELEVQFIESVMKLLGIKRREQRPLPLYFNTY